jgi:uncharacterized protein (TIGR02145 family)
MSSCQKAVFEDEKYAAATFMNSAALEPSDNAIKYYGAETFKIVSKDEPLVETRSLTNPDFKYFQNFMLKVKNGNGNSNRDVSLEILIDNVVVMTSADFTKGRNIVLKELTALTPGSVLEIRLDGAKNKSVTLLIECSLQEDVIADIDGNYYHTVKIGEHWYTTENLKVTRFNNGTPIPLVEENEAWNDLLIINENPSDSEFPQSIWIAPAYCWYNNDISNKDTYGALYTASVAVGSIQLKGQVVDYGNVCPVGWHVGMPVEIFMGESGTWKDAGIYKEAGTEHWASPNTGATNSTGFTALPGGLRTGSFGPVFWSYLGYTGNWWTGSPAMDHGDHGGTFIYMNYDNTNAFEMESYVTGMSIRCMKDF